LLAAVIGALFCGSAVAQFRQIPDTALRGVIRHVQSLVVSIDGTPISLSPGSNIRDTNNFIIVPTALPPAGALADYLVDVNGQIHRVWLLTPQEAAIPRPSRR
jgi:hypothetical protein